MNFRRFVKRVTPILLLGLLLSACTNSGASDTEASGNPEDVTLDFMIWNASDTEGLNEVVAAFEEENPGIQVNVEVTPWDQYWTKLESAALGGSLPDIFHIHTQEFTKFSQGDVMMDLTEFVENSEVLDMNDYPQDIVELYTSEDGDLLAMPRDYDTIGLWYNKEIFDEAGVAYPDETWTWDTLLETAIELTDQEAGIYGFLAPVNSQEGYHSFLYQNEGYVLNEDKTESGFRDPNTIEAMQWYIDLSLEHGVSPTAADFADNDQMLYFQSGQAAMATFGSWQATPLSRNEYTNENVDVAPLPKGKTHATIYNGVGNAIAANTEHPEEALKFLEFMSSAEGMQILGENGVYMPAHEDAREAYLEAYPQFDMESILVDQMDATVLMPYSEQTLRWIDAETQYLLPAFAGEVTVEEVAPDLVNEVESILSTER